MSVARMQARSAGIRVGSRIPLRSIRATSVLAVLLAGCSLLPAAPVPAPFAPLPPASFGASVRAEQILHIRRGESSSTLQCYVEITPQKITLVGATALGQRVLTLNHDAQGLRAESALPPDALRPEQVLTDLQLALWPLAALQAAAGPEWRITEPRPGARFVSYNGEAHTEVHYTGRTAWDGRLWLVNFRERYSLDIESRRLERP